MNEHPPQGPESSPSAQGTRFRLPLSKPRWTYILLVMNVVIWVAMTAYGLVRGIGLNGSQSIVVLLAFGAQHNQLVGQGDYWRLLSSMFLHIGIIHLLFNSYALYLIGRDVESLYGSARFLTIYLLSGLGGSLATYAFGGSAVSAGASGAIFGLIGAETTYFFVHRGMFGARGQAQLRNLMLVAVVNLILGATVPGINNLAHLGGLIFGLGLGWVLVPRYQAPSVLMLGETPLLQDRSSVQKQILGLAVAIVVLLGLTLVGNTRWTGVMDTPQLGRSSPQAAGPTNPFEQHLELSQFLSQVP